MTNQKQFLKLLGLSLLFTLGLFARLLFLPARTLDMLSYIQWYDQIAREGLLRALSDQFIGYNPPFIYLLWLATLTRSFLPKIWAIKLIPLTFDVLNTTIVYQVVRTHFPNSLKPLLAALLFWIAPTILINSSLWGQTDALYTCFLLLAVLFLLKERPIAGVIAFALSLAVKAQAVFLAPLLGVLFFKKRIPWYAFLLVPPVYAIFFLPPLLTGKLDSLFSTYTTQGETFARASMNAANLYFLLPRDAYQASLWIGIPLAALLLLTWVLFYGLKRYTFTQAILVLTSLVSVALTPFLLPKMHDRYFYPADALSIVTAFFVPGTWFLPIAYQVISLLSYLPYLFNLRAEFIIPWAVMVNVIAIGFLLWKQWRMVSTSEGG